MIFEALWEAAQHGELLLIDGGMCHFHVRRDGQITICEIIATRRGAGGEMLALLLAIPNATSLYAKCPSDLAANRWYQRVGFHIEATEMTKRGRTLICYRLPLAQPELPCSP